MSGASDRAYRQVTVFGGSGFLGRQIVQRLAGDGAAVRVAVRRPERAAFPAGTGTAGPITAVRADVWDEATVGPAIGASDAVVNTVGHYVERGRATFEAIHGQGAGRPEPNIEAVAGAPAIKTATLTVTVDYESDAPLA